MKNVITILTCILLFASLSACSKLSDNPDRDDSVTISSLDMEIAEEIPLEFKTVTDNNYPGDGKESSADGYEAAGSYVYLGGAYYVDSTVNGSSRVAFMDFETLNSFPLCARPNCTHDSPETCTAFGLASGATVMLAAYDNSIYFVENEKEISDKTGITNRATVYKADLDGSNRIKVATLENYTLDSFFVSGSKGYTIASEQVLGDDITVNTLEYKYYVAEFDFETNKINIYDMVAHFYSTDSISIIGEYGGMIYYLCTGSEELPQDMSMTHPDWFDAIHSTTVMKFYCFDPQSKTATEPKIPMPGERDGMKWFNADIVAAADGYYVCQQKDTAIIASPDGELMKIDNHRLTETASDIPINGMMFNSDTELATELSTGDIYKLKSEAIGNAESIIAYQKGEYVLYNFLTHQFRKLSPSELFA